MLFFYEIADTNFIEYIRINHVSHPEMCNKNPYSNDEFQIFHI